MLNTDELEKNIQEEYARLQKGKANILIVGSTGVGKSSFINMIFGEKAARTGTGKPITDQIEKFENDKLDVVLYDSIGYEIGGEKEKKFLSEAENLVNNNTGKDAIHIIWYFIDASRHRITDFDLEALSKCKFKEEVKICVGLTKSENVSDEEADSLQKVIIDNKNTCDIPVFLLSTTVLDVSEHQNLLRWSLNVLPDQVQHAFVRSQRISLDLKWDTAKKWIVGHISGAALIGGSPIPFSDAPALIANQSIMIANILRIYGLDSLENVSKNIIINGLLRQIIPTLAKSLIGNLLKFIPVIGSILGGMINAAVAASITSAIGFGINYACYRIYKSIIDGDWEQAEKQINSFSSIVSEYAKDAIKSGKKKPDEYVL